MNLFFFRSILLFLFVALGPWSLRAQTDFGAIDFFNHVRQAEWTEVYQAINQELPRTAVEKLEPIYQVALAEEAWGEAIRALAMIFIQESRFEESGAEGALEKLAAALVDQPEPLQALIHLLLADWYWSYFEQNRWQFNEREDLVDGDSGDVRTWSTSRLLEEVERHFEAALEDRDLLRSIPLPEMALILTTSKLTDNRFPTLYDFAIHSAVNFYQAGEQAARRMEDHFVLDGDSLALADHATFLAWEIPAREVERSFLAKSLVLLQEATRYHWEQERELTWGFLTLTRLRIAQSQAIGPMVNARYQEALETLVGEVSEPVMKAAVLFNLAEHARSVGNLAQAHAWATEANEIAPRSYEGLKAFNLIGQIERKTLEVQVESIWNAPWPDIQVQHRNLEKVYFRVLPMRQSQALDHLYAIRGHRDRPDIPRRSAVLEWAVELTPSEDFAMVKENVPLPGSLKPGFYLLLTSTDSEFREEEGQVTLGHVVTVSELSAVLRPSVEPDTLDGLVVEALTGEPRAGLKVTAFERTRGLGPDRKLAETRTDENGLFRFSERMGGVYLVIENGSSSLLLPRISAYPDWMSRDRPIQQIHFFTDRAIYRPGQTIHYKGVASRHMGIGQSYQLLTDQRVQVVLTDVNNQVVARNFHSTNDFGSVSGTFIAPEGMLTGQMRISSTDRLHGSTSVAVEEYQRPRFRVEVDPAPTDLRLGDSVAVTGKATTYTGAPVDGGTYRWRVEREARFPRWRWWSPPSGTDQVQPIARGSGTTGEDGSFSLDFNAHPDLRMAAEEDPVFIFRVHVEVTDQSGETRMAQSRIALGYSTRQVLLQAADWSGHNTALAVRALIRNHDEEPITSAGELKVFAVQQPERVVRERITGSRWGNSQPEISLASADPRRWPLVADREPVYKEDISTNENGIWEGKIQLEPGLYRIELTVPDPVGQPARAEHLLTVIDSEADHYPIRVPSALHIENSQLEPGETLRTYWGTGYEHGRALVEILRENKVLERYWTDPEGTLHPISFPITEELRGGLYLRVTTIRDNRLYEHREAIDVPWTNKDLHLHWEIFRSELSPGQEETWTLRITGPDAEAAAAEFVGTLFDASLDALLLHNWHDPFTFFRPQRFWPRAAGFANRPGIPSLRIGNFGSRQVRTGYQFDPEFHPIVRLHQQHPFAFGRGGIGTRSQMYVGSAPEMVADPFAAPAAADAEASSVEEPAPTSVSPDNVPVRTNLQETAFFYPHLRTDEDGVITITFTMPEALTEWRFIGFAHDRNLRRGLIEGTTVTARDLMVRPLAPRFIREGDQIQFPVQVFNRTDTEQEAFVRLRFYDARTMEPVGGLTEQAETVDVKVPAGQSRTVFWPVAIPAGTEFLIFRAVAGNEAMSDGEEGYLPVLPRQILVTESLPLPLRGPGTTTARFDSLADSANSPTLRHERLQVEMVSQPAWYALLALPTLMEFPHECVEQTFNRWYAHQIGGHVVRRHPRIERVFRLWRETGAEALTSPLEKNESLKSVTLQETPWVRQGRNETARRGRIGLLFEENNLRDEGARALAKLAEQQLPDGLWPWFSGGRPNHYISLYVATGMGRLRHLGVAEIDQAMAHRAWRGLDRWMAQRYRQIKEDGNPNAHHLSHLAALYLYGRSFFLEDLPVESGHWESVRFWLTQAETHALHHNSRQTQGHAALALHRFQTHSHWSFLNPEIPLQILRSIRENAIESEELGLYWPTSRHSWWWHQAPIETQAVLIEAFAEITADDEAVEGARVWLLKQKQVQDWRTTKATADAVYALLVGGRDWLASDKVVKISLGGERVDPGTVEPGTGYYAVTFSGAEVTPQMAEVALEKTDEGISWGSLHWQYFEDLDRIEAAPGTALSLEKALFVRETGPSGPVLRPVGEDPLRVGDRLVTRIILRVDRDMEFVHLKDERGSGLEPVNVLSGHRYQDGLRYYESTLDTASHFFIESLPRGTYVFTTDSHVRHAGTFASGRATIQSMYAPEFSSHSAGQRLSVKPTNPAEP